MTQTDRVFKAMNYGQVYDQATLAAMTHIPEEDVGQVLRLLDKSGMIECLREDRYRKNRQYATKQRQIFK